MGGKTRTSGQGRPKGIPNKATTEARTAISKFVDGNAHRLQAWLDSVADGVTNDEGEYVVAPNPEKAFTLFQSVIEYHIPKLARQEVTGELTINTSDALAEIKAKRERARTGD